MRSKILSRPIAAAAIVVAVLMQGPGVAFAVDLGAPATKADTLAAARILVKRGDYRAAITALTRVVQINGYNADAHNLLGYAYRNDGRLEEAARAYAVTLRLNPRHRGALEYQGELFLTLKEPEKAQANLDMLAEICGQTCEEFLDLDKALQAYQAGS